MLPKNEPVLPVVGFPRPVAAEFLPGRMTPEDALALTATFYDTDDSGDLRNIPEIAAFANRWKDRAYIRLGNLAAFFEDFEDPTGRTLSARSASAFAESRLCKTFGGTTELFTTLNANAEHYRAESEDWYRKRGVPRALPVNAADVPANDTAPVDSNLPALPSEMANGFAILILSGLESEGFILSFCTEWEKFRNRNGMTGRFRGVTCRVELREEIQKAVHRGRAVAAWLKPGEAHSRPGPKTENLPRESACPVCLYGFYLYRSMGMECGMNIGAAVCPGCASRVEIRAYNGDTPDARGEALRAFRVGEAPV